MSLIRGRTRWVLFLSSSGEPDQRHIFDLVFGLVCLEKAGVLRDDISIYVDCNDPAVVSPWFKAVSNHSYELKSSRDFFLDLQVNKHDNMVMFVTGHGSIEGIDAPAPIKPFALIDGLKKAPGLAQAIIYLGQCYAGIFNYIGAGKRQGKDAGNDPDIILVGATSLHQSISASTTEDFPIKGVSWVANLFLLHVFKWISSPVDVDGDGRCTVIDSYKYAGVHSNTSNKEVKAHAFHSCMRIYPLLMEANATHAKDPTDQNRLNLMGLNTRYGKELDMHATHQECWILNAIPAQSLEF